MKEVVETEEERFFVIVPETVQTENINYQMEAGRLIAQSFHLARHLQERKQDKHVQITTIILAARNSKELRKIATELHSWSRHEAGDRSYPVSQFMDHNPEVYKTDEYVLTACCIGPVPKSRVDHIIGHLELY